GSARPASTTPTSSQPPEPAGSTVRTGHGEPGSVPGTDAPTGRPDEPRAQVSHVPEGGRMNLRTKVSAAVATGLVLGALALPTAPSAADGYIVYGWGLNGSGETGAPTSSDTGPTQINMFATDFTQVSAGFGFSLALRADGTVWAWGGNSSGQL